MWLGGRAYMAGWNSPRLTRSVVARGFGGSKVSQSDPSHPFLPDEQGGTQTIAISAGGVEVSKIAESVVVGNVDRPAVRLRHGGI